MNSSIEPIGVCVVVIANTRVLLGKRLNAYRAGYYGLPGGRVEQRESLMDSARRELHEETGLRSKELRYIGVIRDLQEGDRTLIHFAFRCDEYEGEPGITEPDKCEGWKWFNPTQIPGLTLPGHKAAIDLSLNMDLPGYREILSGQYTMNRTGGLDSLNV